MVTGNYNLHLDTIDSDAALSTSRFKGFKFSKSSYYDEVLPQFFSGVPAETAFKVRTDDDQDLMFTDFSNQYDDIYQSGCRNIYNNKSYEEEYECFAPLYLGDSLPTHFIIFRIDGPGLITLSKDNFKSEILNNLKCVKSFNLTKVTPLGEWLEMNYLTNRYKPDYPLYIDFRQLEFSSWRGIDYETGGWASKNVFLDELLQKENTFFDFEKTITDGFKNNKVVFPNILNLSFLFDDTPATPKELRKWSLNRYMGFYVNNLKFVRSYSPYTLKQLRQDIVVRPGNIIFSASGENPFVSEWNETENNFIEIGGIYFKVERYSRPISPTETKIQLNTDVFSDEVVRGVKYYYKIISTNEYNGLTYSGINSKTLNIQSDENGYYMKLSDESDLLPEWNTAGVWLVYIDNIYHVIRKTDNKYYLNSDYGFELSDKILKYWIDESDVTKTKQIALNIDNPIINFAFYKIDFTDIKDFENSIVDTQFSRYEYEKELALTNSTQPKLYSPNLESKVNPKPFDEYFLEGKITNVPCSSEYTANSELFRIIDNRLTELWNKNATRIKWCFDSSLSANDYPYLLNNSFVADDFNSTCNPFNLIPKRWDRNLDHFYTINSSTWSYEYHSLHVESHTASGYIDTNFNFDLPLYLSIENDYFTWFFGKNNQFLQNSNIKQTQKWSTFQKGDDLSPNTTLFRGIKFDIHDLASIKIEEGSIKNISLVNYNTFQDYKFSILLSKNDKIVTASQSSTDTANLQSTNNQMSWYLIDNWRYSKQYQANDIIFYQNFIWISTANSKTDDPSKNPSLLQEWQIHGTASTFFPGSYSIFWSPSKDYQSNDFVYYDGDYYYYEPRGTSYSFWNPKKTYDIGDLVIYNKKIWQSTTASNFYQPGASNLKSDFVTSSEPYFWFEYKGKNVTDWQLIEIWSSNYIYGTNSITKNNLTKIVLPGKPYSIWKEVLYQLKGATSSTDSPDNSQDWNRIYSMLPDTNFVYNPQTNPVIKLNNTFYLCTGNSTSSTLENGICVYIHKKWKNILINYYINDNTLNNLSNADRDSIYTDIYTNLTAANLINSLSDLSKKYGFSDYLQYVIIEEDGTLKRYDFENLQMLPFILIPKLPDRLYTRYNSLKKDVIGPQQKQINVKNILQGYRIETIDMLNYYDGSSLGTTILPVVEDIELIPNYHGLQNKIYNVLWRYSGNYSPLFYNIPLFKIEKDGEAGNFIFDTSVTDFGMIKERHYSKVNRVGNILKFRFQKDIRSIYPKLDEFGYHWKDFFIFKSTWDNEFYTECLELQQSDIPVLVTNKIIRFE
jgi:hypothetical protein